MTYLVRMTHLVRMAYLVRSRLQGNIKKLYDENDEIDDACDKNDTRKKIRRRMGYTYVMPSSRTV